ncbi:hypothetical protein [Chengkuizengella axinellae]|uniref:Uncharacterized protein n=1 Tax=Chengkuizengella axinellae TaxID=3064388 RepID=A0ABT9ITK1_9BACL|nr:hypothetical protein [Chengkuizengella sp. 2205SS18-9]MDP5272679.1 hypothetical protein [Chengkuizengella sp. 2205SS18-9]
MNVYIEPTLHIVDIDSDFILTTKDKNLKMNLSDKQKDLTYKLLQKIKLNSNISLLLEDNKSFESQMLQVLMKNNIVRLHTDEEESVIIKGIHCIHGKLSFLKSIQQQISTKSKMIESNYGQSLCLDDEVLNKKEIYVYVCRESLYIATKPLNKLNTYTVDSEMMEQYASFVLMEKLRDDVLDIRDTVIIKIDLTLYNNEIDYLITEQVNEINYSNSCLVDDKLSGYTVDFNVENYFPLVQCKYQGVESNRNLSSIGYDKEDAIRNLFIILNGSGIDEQYFIRGSHTEYPLNSESFLRKFINIYFSKKIYIHHIEEDHKQFKSDNMTIIYKGKNTCNEHTLFLTLFVNHQFEGKELKISGNEIINEQLKEIMS